jgi:hypothetical protein
MSSGITTLTSWCGGIDVFKKLSEDEIFKLINKKTASARKLNICFGDDRRAYIPEKLRGKGVGYGKHGK